MLSRSAFCCILLSLVAGPGALFAQEAGEEALDYYRKWLDEDVVYIITPEEEEVFRNLSTADEKDQFIEQFWLRRDSDPSTSSNEFKEEHYRRIAYANEKFHAGIEGWRTDRGMIYIRFGPPAGIEKHPEGGTYTRKLYEGGGTTYTYPFEVWFYNYLSDIGSGIEIEFVDVSRTNEYRIAQDADQKDALFYVPNAGQTMAEAMGTRSRLDRIRTRYLGNPEGGVAGIDTSTQVLRYQDYPMVRLERLYRLQKSPAVKYKDLERVVTTRVTYSELKLQLRSDPLRMSETRAMVPVTLFLHNRELTFQPIAEGSEVFTAKLNVFGQVENLGGRILYTFEDELERRFLEADLERGRASYSMFQKRFPLEGGRYKLSIVVRDQVSGKVGTAEHLIVVPVAQKQLQSSAVILTRQLTVPRPGETIADPFVLGKYRIVPTLDNHFVVEDQFVQAYFEVYNLALDQSSLQPRPQVEISLKRGEQEIFPFTPVQQEFEFDNDRLLIYKTIPFKGLGPGNYTLVFRVTDQVASSGLEKEVEFVVVGSAAG